MASSTTMTSGRLILLAWLVTASLAVQVDNAWALDVKPSRKRDCPTKELVSRLSNFIKGINEAPLANFKIPESMIYSFFTDCTFEEAERLLQAAGFKTVRTDPITNSKDLASGVLRQTTGRKTLKLYPLGSSSCVIDVKVNRSGSLDVQGEIRADGP